jgi:phosphate transport system substrate-binding protein
MKLAVTAAVTTAVFVVPSAATAKTKTILGSGSSATAPYAEALFKGYKKVNPNLKFIYNPNNGNAGVKDVQARRSAFALQTRPPLPSDSGTTYAKLFLDGLCIAVNPANSLSGTSIATVKDIYTAKLTEWSGVPGSSLTTPISAFGRFSTAGLYTFFQSAVLAGETQSSNVTALDKDGEVAVAVSKNESGIGYVGLANSGPGKGVKRLKLNGQPCQASAIKTLKYPLSRYAWLVLPTKNPSRDVQAFGDWIRTSVAAGKIIAAAGAVPAFNKTK